MAGDGSLVPAMADALHRQVGRCSILGSGLHLEGQMPKTRDAKRGATLLAVLLVVALSLVGCELVVEDPQGSAADDFRPPASTSATELPLYDVTVSAIDFDPPLKRETLLGYQGSVKLLAAVENKGTMPLTNLTVDARIVSQKGDFSAEDGVPVRKISPGETKVVEFGGMVPATTLPKSPSYRIRVTVESGQLGPEVRSNVREVIVRVVDSGVNE
jgi:hypothetical protein